MLIPSFLLMYLIITKTNKIENHFSKSALEKLSIKNNYFTNKTRNIFLFLSLIFMIIALARPVTNEKTQNNLSSTIPIIIALDVSKSMKAIDIYPNRLEFAKQKLLSILESSNNNGFGIILFAKSSFLLSPVTEDLNSLKILINNLDTGINFDNGTNIYSTLETSQKLLKNYSNKNLLILTDGGDEDEFKEEIKFSKENKIKIYTLATATKNGSAIKEENGNFLTTNDGKIVNVKLNQNLKNLSLETNGGYIEHSLNNSDINQILEDINNKSSKENIEKKEYKTYTELFYYPLFFSIILLLIAFFSLPNLKKNINVFLVLFLFSFISKTPIYASSIFDFKIIDEANKAYENSEFSKSSNEFSKLDSNEYRDYNLANSLYKEKKYKEAIELYKNIKTSSNDLEFKKLHNLANSYALTKDFQNAVKTYEEALKIKNDSKTKENLELIKKLLENKNEQNKNKDENQQEKNKEEKDAKNKKEEEKKSNDLKENNMDKKEEKNSFEEEKWLKQIENQKTNSLLKKMESSKKEDSISKPW